MTGGIDHPAQWQRAAAQARARVSPSSELVDRQQVGMIEAAGGAGLLLEPAQATGICSKSGRKDFDGHIGRGSRAR